MESYKGRLKGFWRRRHYHRAAGGQTHRRRFNRAELGGGEGRRRFWRIKISPRIASLRAVSPRRILARIRDAYVRMMLSFSGAVPAGVTYAGYGFGAGNGGTGFARPPPKEYDERVLVQIYKSLIAASAATGTGGSAIALGR
ncbi:hypothetical protein Cni_G15410 [Canna indica]|uniref:Uncharacterized protein n=1 Tax=Canna indica TaxID=4628 RepID=A0AAQ3QER5_9LILI|nr:hypothetical protein Cni_G15410 [Canna indica]